jgi:hypothetical protein
MHDCPRCGQACTCSGDIDDTYVLTKAWVLMNCRCDCEDIDVDIDVGLDNDWVREEDYPVFDERSHNAYGLGCTET